jgi:aspartyl-tRNA(Asn)/glutamyl-tRNA(Gln) amidotransferase subunit A
MSPLNLLTLREAVSRVRTESLSAADVWDACANQIRRLDPQLRAFITSTDRRQIPENLPEQSPDNGMSPLAGAPIAVKDMFETAGILTTAGSLFFQDHVPVRDATVVARLRTAGGQIIGKTNTHEIALGVTNINPHFGTCRNPWDMQRVSGGSSGGSAVAVATGMALAAIGTDTGGSIRIPASLCGVVGLKPTFGRVSLRGVFPLSWNLDHAGPLTRCVADAAFLLGIMAGYDEEDPQSMDQPLEDYEGKLEDGVDGWRMALAAGSYLEDSDPEVLKAVESAADLFRVLGARVERVDLSYLRDAALANGLMTQADGATYHRQRLAEKPHLFGEDVRRRLLTGRDTRVSDYVQARQTQTEMRRRLAGLFREHDLILLPATPITAPRIEGADAIEHARRLTRFTAPFNLTGLPAISIPCGFSKQGLPIGLQIVGGAWREAQLLQAARAYERKTQWGARPPPVVGNLRPDAPRHSGGSPWPYLQIP